MVNVKEIMELVEKETALIGMHLDAIEEINERNKITLGNAFKEFTIIDKIIFMAELENSKVMFSVGEKLEKLTKEVSTTKESK